MTKPASVREVVSLTILPGKEAEFEDGVKKALPFFQSSKGCVGFELRHLIEQSAPYQYQLIVEWATLDDHLVGFRNSENFTKWRECVSSFFAAPPAVFHTATVFRGF